MKRNTRSIRIVPCLAVATLACVAATAATAATPLVTVHPAHLPLSVGLPSGWQSTALAPGSRFDAAATNGSGHLVVSVGAYLGPFKAFAKSETAAARAYYRTKGGTLTTKTVTLPSGPALQINVLEHGSALAITIFALLHKIDTYLFTYYTSESQAATSAPDFGRSARSIQFTK